MVREQSEDGLRQSPEDEQTVLNVQCITGSFQKHTYQKENHYMVLPQTIFRLTFNFYTLLLRLK